MIFKSQTMRSTLAAMMDVMQRWQGSSEEFRDDLINPDAPMVVQVGDYGYEVQSIGGDGDLEGFVMMCKPDPVCKWDGIGFRDAEGEDSMNDRELLQKAYGLLEEISQLEATPLVVKRELLDAFRARLAKPEPEPVAWRVIDGEGRINYVSRYKDSAESWLQYDATRRLEPLYTAPSQPEPARCDEYCSNHGCNDGPACPARSSAWRKRQITDEGKT